MGTVIKDRRNEPPSDKFGTDRERFRQRYLASIKSAIQDKIEKDNLDDLSRGGVKVPIPKETSHEPIIHHIGGDHTRVFPGNVGFDVGDRIIKSNGNPGNGASTDSEDREDDFIWISESEFLDLLFEGRSLPDMSKFKSQNVTMKESEWAGYTNKGPENLMNMERTNRKRREESLVLEKGAERRIINNLTEQFNILSANGVDIPRIEIDEKSKQERLDEIWKAVRPIVGTSQSNVVLALNSAVSVLKERYGQPVQGELGSRLSVLEQRLIEQFKSKSKSGNFQERHLTYNYNEDVVKPNAKAVMFCQMDVSFSMTQERKNTAKVFFWLLNKFLKEVYEEVDVIFIAHTDVANEVDEQTFFYGRDSGGTMVSSCLLKTQEIIKERYDLSEWNVYSAQASDGDNSTDDNDTVVEVMSNLLPDIQGHYYVEIGRGDDKSDLFQAYEDLSRKYQGKIRVATDVMTAPDALRAFKEFFPANGSSLSEPKSHYVPS